MLLTVVSLVCVVVQFSVLVFSSLQGQICCPQAPRGTNPQRKVWECDPVCELDMLGLGFRLQGLGSVCELDMLGLEFRVQAIGFRVQALLLRWTCLEAAAFIVCVSRFILISDCQRHSRWQVNVCTSVCTRAVLPRLTLYLKKKIEKQKKIPPPCDFLLSFFFVSAPIPKVIHQFAFTGEKPERIIRLKKQNLKKKS